AGEVAEDNLEEGGSTSRGEEWAGAAGSSEGTGHDRPARRTGTGRCPPVLPEWPGPGRPLLNRGPALARPGRRRGSCRPAPPACPVGPVHPGRAETPAGRASGDPP